MNKSYHVLFLPHASIRTDLIPKPGILALDASGLLTLTDTNNNQTIVQTPLRDLQAVRPFNIGKFTKPYTILLYVSLNEAFRVIFTSNNPVANDGIQVYEKLLEGDMTGGLAALQDYTNANKVDKNAWQTTRLAQNADYNEFLQAAKEAGVYRGVMTSLPSVAGMILIVGIILFLLIAVIRAQ